MIEDAIAKDEIIVNRVEENKITDVLQAGNALGASFSHYQTS